MATLEHMSLRALRVRLLSVSSLVVIAASSLGCAYRTPSAHVPAPIAPLDPKTLELTDFTVVEGAHDASPELAAKLRQEAAEILAVAAAPGAVSGKPSRVHVHVDVERRRDIFDTMREDGMAAMVLFVLPLGVDMGRARVSVDVTVDTGGRTYKGHGTGDKLGSIYARPLRRALAVALDDALSHASVSTIAP
jgi:hypothetical protein